MSARPAEERKCHPTLDPNGVVRECRDSDEHPATTPIVVAFDLTQSRGQDTEIVCKKLPSMIGQIHMNAYVPDPEICFVGTGDAKSDHAPLQLGQFESDSRLDGHLRNMWIEKGGGGTGQESYELTAYALARKTVLGVNARGKKGFAFFLGDEGFYPEVDRDEVRRVLGDDLQANIPSSTVFRELQEKFHTYFIFPRASWEDRKASIDKEISQRVKRAGGMIEGVDIRFSLIWHNRNDLDLHVVTPANEHIYYGNKIVSCGGNLDVDMNVRGETTKPVENIRWKKGSARKGEYRVYVQNYSFHEQNREETPFKVEIVVGGKVEHFEGTTPEMYTHESSNVEVGRFYFDPAETRETPDATKRYELYDDKVVRTQWASVIPEAHILLIDDPKASVDVMLGVLALVSGSRDLPGYTEDLKAKGQTPERIAEVTAALKDLALAQSAPTVDLSGIPGATGVTANRKGRSKRL